MGDITYHQEMRRCGKQTCRACQSGPAHGPYWYAVWRDEHGRRRKRYCGKSKPEGIEGGASVAVPPIPQSKRVPVLHVRMLGGFEVELAGVRLSERHWTRSSARRLFALLLLHPEGLLREEVIELLWPESPPGNGQHALSTALSALRLVLEPEHGRTSVRIPLRAAAIRLQLFPGDRVDTHVFSAEQHAERLDLESLTELLDLYRGDLLPEFLYEDWSTRSRESLRERWHTLSLHLARKLEEYGHGPAAIEWLEGLLAHDRTDEEGARQLMALLAWHGRRSDALRVYERLVHALDEELGVAPDDRSQSLAGRLRRDDGSLTHLPLYTLSGRSTNLRECIRRLAGGKDPASAHEIARLSSERALLLERHGELQEALCTVESGRLAIRHRDLPTDLARLLTVEAQIRVRQGQSRAAEDAAEQAERLARRADADDVMAEALRVRAQVAQQLGHGEQAVALARFSAAMYDGMGAEAEALLSRRIVALNLWYAGRYAEGEALYRRNLEQARDLSDVEQEAYILCGLGSALRGRGDLERAEPRLLDALDLATRMEDQFLILSAEYHLANLWVDRADSAVDRSGRERAKARSEAERRFERVLKLSRAGQYDSMLTFGAIDLAMALTDWGQPLAAQPMIEVARGTLHRLPDATSAHGWALLAEADLALALADAPRALDRVTAAIPLLEEASPSGLAQAHRVAALAGTALGNSVAITHHWTSSLVAAARCDQRLEEVRTDEAMARGTCQLN